MTDQRKYNLTFPSGSDESACPFLMAGSLKIEFSKDGCTGGLATCDQVKFHISMNGWNYHPSDEDIGFVLKQLRSHLAAMKAVADQGLLALDEVTK